MTHRKVLIVTDGLSNGGAERQLVLLAKYLPNEWECRIWSMNGGPFAEEIRKQGIPIEINCRRWQWDVTPAVNLWRLIRQWQPDIIHSWGWMTTLAAFPIAKVLRIPLVNGIVRSGRSYYYRGTLNKGVSYLGDVVVSNSRAGLINWRIKPSRGVVIYNGFDNCRILSSPKEKIWQENGRFIVVMAARMTREKDFTLFLSALRKLVEMGQTNWKFIAIGHGEDKDNLIKENLDLVQEGLLEFPDAGTDVIPFLQMSDVGVLLTRSLYHEEGCSNTILEYMACGLPVIATDSGGNKELIEDNKTGFIIPDGDLENLVNKLFWFFKNPDEAKKFGERGKNRLNETFSTSKMVQSTVYIYENQLSRK